MPSHKIQGTDLKRLDATTDEEIHQQIANDSTRSVNESGPWHVYAPKHSSHTNPDENIGIRSADFSHDVVLWISGDFKSYEDKFNYALEIAKRLNAYKM